MTFTSNGSMFVIDPGFYGSTYSGGGFLNSDYAGPPNVITAALPSAATALGLNYGGLEGGPVTFNFTLSDGSTFSGTTSQTIAGGSLDFIGITSTVALTSVQIAMPDNPDYNAIDNFSFGAAVVATPEPATILSAGIAAVLGAGYTALRRRRQA